MKKTLLIIALGLVAATSAAQDYSYSWSSVRMDASRTGTKSTGPNDIKESMGEVKGKKFYAPNGKVYKGSAAKAAKALIEAQDAMAPTKEIVGYSAEHLAYGRTETALGNFAVDRIREGVEKAFGKKIDVAITNFGGIRIDMPKGDVLKEDIISMFPFNNYLCCVTLSGEKLLKVFQVFADYSAQPVSGATVVLDHGRLVDVKVGGESIDENRIYTLGTIDFLLDGGDHFYIGKDAVVEKSQVKVSECILEYLEGLKADGGVIESHIEGRVTYLKN